MCCYMCVAAAMYLLHMFGVIIAVMHSSSSSSGSSGAPVKAVHCLSAVHVDTTGTLQKNLKMY